MINNLGQREIFHITFLRQLARRAKVGAYALKGGCNLRLFFKSPRYSEDMDLDAQGVPVHLLRDSVMEIISSKTMGVSLKPYGIEEIIPPDVRVAKQTETVQRFKVHLVNSSGEDLFTKVEFSRRGLDKDAKVEDVDRAVLERYRQPPLIIPHYPALVACRQKLAALISRVAPQVRDVFDIFIILPQTDQRELKRMVNKAFDRAQLKAAGETLFSFSYGQYRDAVCAYLSEEDKGIYENKDRWEDIQLAVAALIEKED